ncbi:MAG TPA: choice-of-anchor tandem repeat GloVer-containing protein [Terriglobales bacterium]|jgi:uncharacterized repeat protein (TIGR03803 family)|nr:choice-of-anchor tandem repeat GloVer-containing protein [Terriglobales bacterium]
MVKLNCWKALFMTLTTCASIAVAARGQTLTTLVVFEGPNGLYPYGSFTQGRDGNLYGTTSNGGPDNSGNPSDGVIFDVTPAGAFRAVYSFCGAKHCRGGALPYAGLVLGTDGSFYGTTAYGGPKYGAGAIFKVTSFGELTFLHLFDRSDGVFPTAALIQASDGNLYGTTVGGGSDYHGGTIFRVSTRGVFETLHDFTGIDGEDPLGLVQGADGNLYGTTGSGGIGCFGGDGCGTVFKITLAGELTTLLQFGVSDPFPSGLILGSDGNLYGTTYGGDGTVFKITPQGILTTLCNLSSADGSGPEGNLVEGSDGNLYGVTQYGGTAQLGNIFMVTPTGTATELYSFSGPDGADPLSGLFQATNGTFYGMTNGGGDDACYPYNRGCGVAFSLSTGLRPFVAFVHSYGRVGHTVGILGQGFVGTTSVEFNGTAASFTVVSDSYLTATVPAGATTGYLTAATPSGTLTSNVPFQVIR